MDMQYFEEGDLSPRFGQSYINVYLPREEDSNLPDRNVPPPSPVFSVSSIYKFSDDVIKDRHLFLGRKAFYHRYVKGEERRHGRGGNAAPVPTSPILSDEDRDDDYMAINVVRLALDSSNNDSKESNAKMRFNERLSSYVANQKKIKSAQNHTGMEGSKTPRASSTNNDAEPEPNSFQTVVSLPNPNSPRRTKRELSFKTVSTHITTPKLPSLDRAKTYDVERSYHREMSVWFPEMGKERTFWTPETAAWYPTCAFAHGRMPTRPSPKPHKIWRQSTEYLIGRKTPRIHDLTTDRIMFPQRTSNSPSAFGLKSLA